MMEDGYPAGASVRTDQATKETVFKLNDTGDEFRVVAKSGQGALDAFRAWVKQRADAPRIIRE